MVLQRLREELLYGKFSKCDFWHTQVVFLGHVVSGEKVSMDLEKVRVVLDWLRPTTVIEVRSFLGLARYYQHFIEGFACLAYPMTKLTPNGVSFVWDNTFKRCF